MTQSKRVALFVTCLVDQIFPEIGVATVQLLRRSGYEVEFPQSQTCCGQPFLNSGFREEAVRLAKRTIETFAQYEAVVLPSGSCAAALRTKYPSLFEPSSEWHHRAENLVAKTYELSQFLTHEAQWEPKPSSSNLKVTYHDSCHSNRLINVRQEPRKLLEKAGCSLHEMTESDRCCGFGGLFSVRMPEISNAITREKIRQAEETGADVLVTIDPGCLMQMRGLVTEPSSLRVEHLAIILEKLTR